MSAAQKYAYLQVFSIPTAEPKDSEIDSHEVSHSPPVATKPAAPPPSPPPATSPSGEKLMSEPQKKLLYAKMREAGLSSEESKLVFSFAQPKTSKQASYLIEHLDAVITDWRTTLVPQGDG
jgi:hypothetical protein